MDRVGYVFEHRWSGERRAFVGVGLFPLIDATRQLRDEEGYPDDWDVVVVGDAVVVVGEG